MVTRSLGTLLFTGVFVMVALFAVNGVMAQEECSAPDIIYLKVKTNGTPTPEDYDWKVLVSVKELEGDDAGLFEYTYSATNPDDDNNGLDYITVSYPDCCPDDKDIEITPIVPNKTDIFDVGVGEPTMNVGRGDYGSFLIKWTPSSINAPVFKADTANSGGVSVNLKVGSKLLGGIIRGPACRGFAQNAVSVYKEIFTVTDVGIKRWCIEENPKTQCGTVVPCEGETINKVALSDLFADKTKPVGEEFEPVTEIINPVGGGCPSFTVKSGEHSWWYYCSGGWCYY